MIVFKKFPVINLVATGANIQRLRKEKGLSIADLQNYFGFDAPQAIYKWQRGETIPTIENLVALACILSVSIDEIVASECRTTGG